MKIVITMTVMTYGCQTTEGVSSWRSSRTETQTVEFEKDPNLSMEVQALKAMRPLEGGLYNTSSTFSFPTNFFFEVVPEEEEVVQEVEDFSALELDWEIQDSEEDDPREDYEESDDDYQDRLERSWEKYEDQIPVKEDQSKWLTLDEVVSASLPEEIVVDEEGELVSFDYYTGIKVAKKRGLVQTTDFQEVRQGTHFIVTCGDVMFSVNSDEYPQVARRSLKDS